MCYSVHVDLNMCIPTVFVYFAYVQYEQLIDLMLVNEHVSDVFPCCVNFQFFF